MPQLERSPEQVHQLQTSQIRWAQARRDLTRQHPDLATWIPDLIPSTQVPQTGAPLRINGRPAVEANPRHLTRLEPHQLQELLTRLAQQARETHSTP